MLLVANSLIDGFLKSNGVGQGIVYAQLIASIAMFSVIFGKWKQLVFVKLATKRFLRDFSACGDVLEYYMARRPQVASGIEGIYKMTCERMFKLLSPQARSRLVGHSAEGEGAAALTAREIELVKGTCDHALEEQEIVVESGMGLITTVVALSPMLGLLGTVWGVLDAFYEMGSAGSATLATIAPSISSALVTTVVGLLIAIPGIICNSVMGATVRGIVADMEGFADELNGRIACEFQGRGA